MIPQTVIYLLILGSLILTAIGAIVLLALLIKDKRKKSIW